MMASQTSLIACAAVLIVLMIASTNGLQCHICGQFNDGVGSITPCLNYTETNAHLHLKECPRKSDKFCVVSKRPTGNQSKPHKQNFPFSIITFLFLHVSSEKSGFLVFACRRWSEKRKLCLWRWGGKVFFSWAFLVGRRRYIMYWASTHYAMH